MLSIPFRPRRKSSQIRPVRRFVPAGLSEGSLEGRCVPGSIFGTGSYVDQSQANDPAYYPPPDDPYGTELIEYYGAKVDDSTTFASSVAVSGPYSPNDPFEVDGGGPNDIPTSSMEVNHVVSMQLDPFNYPSPDGIYYGLGHQQSDQYVSYQFNDPNTTPPPVDVHGGFHVSLSVSPYAVGYVQIDFHTDFADVEVNGYSISASWQDGGSSYSYSGSLYNGSFSMGYSGVVTDGTFDLHAYDYFAASACVVDADPPIPPGSVTLSWGFSQEIN